ncbi:MAG: hypothetical protein ACP5QR_04915 [Rhizomicrobium sp.]
MPVVAVLGAAATMAMGGASAIGAVIAGSAGVMTTFEAVAAVGVTLGAIGAVTGDKGLQTAGLIMGGIGGIGALASSAGVFGADATTGSIFGSSSSNAADAAYASTLQPVNITANSDAFASAATSAAQSAATQDIINSIQPVDITPNVDTFSSGIAPVDVTQNSNLSGNGVPNLNATGVTATTPLGQQGTTAGTTAGTSVGSSNVPVPTPNPGVGSSASSIPPSPVEVPQGAGTVTGIPGVPAANLTAPSDLSTALTQPSVSQLESGLPGPSLSERLGNLLKFANKNRTVAFGAMQVGGSLLNGLFSPLTTPQIAALNAQAAANRAAATLTNQQVANMQAPLPVASRTGSPAVTGSPAGLINTPPPTSANVTGTANTMVPGGGSFGGVGATGTYGI